MKSAKETTVAELVDLAAPPSHQPAGTNVKPVGVGPNQYVLVFNGAGAGKLLGAVLEFIDELHTEANMAAPSGD